MTNPPVCVIRADASPTIGGGHVMRCLTLAGELHALGWKVVLAAAPETRNTMTGLLPKWLAQISLPEAAGFDPSQLKAALPEGCGLVIVDHYGLDAAYEKPLHGWAERIFVIDDLADRPHHCDVLLDQTLGRIPGDYTKLVPAQCTVLTGPGYGLLRREFALRRFTGLRPAEQRFPPRRIVVFIGLGDPDAVSRRALDAIDASGLSVEVRVILGRSSPALESAEIWVSQHPGASVHLNVTDMAEHLAWADLAIGTAGTSSWERCCLALPTVAVILADNQELVAKALASAGAALVVGRGTEVSAEKLGAALRGLADDRDRLIAMSAVAAGVCDGLGAARVAMHLAPVQDRQGAALTLRPITADDANLVYTWQSIPEVRRFSRNPEAPTPDQHRVWMAARLSAVGAVTEIILRGGTPAGMVRLDALEEGGFEVSILVAPAYQGAGVGSGALHLLRRLVPLGVLKAYVTPINKASLGAFARAGYRPAGKWLINEA